MDKPLSPKHAIIVDVDSVLNGDYNHVSYSSILRTLATDHLWFKLGLKIIASGFDYEINRYLKSLGCLTIYDARLSEKQAVVLPIIEKRKYNAFISDSNQITSGILTACKGKMSHIVYIGDGFNPIQLVGADCLYDKNGIAIISELASPSDSYRHFTFLESV